MKIHTIYAGGTIGMVESEHGLVPGANLSGWLHSRINGTELEGRVSITEFARLIDSANSTPLDWQAIIDDLWANREQAEAFIVLHGTDTMAYTSAALAFALTGFQRPVVMTGAQHPIASIGSEAGTNVTGAFQAVISERTNGVSLFFGQKLLSGARATKVSSWAYAGFDSPNCQPLAETGGQWNWLNPPRFGKGWRDPKPYEKHDVVVIDFYPGITPQRFAALVSPQPEAVILRGFGVGNGPNDDETIGIIHSLTDSGVPVIMTSQCAQANITLDTYGTGEAYARAGVISSCDMTHEATFAKTIFLLSQGLRGRDLAEWMPVNIAGELTDDRAEM